MTNEHQHVVTPAAFRTPEAALYLGVSKATVKKLVRDGKIKSVKLNRARVFPMWALDALLTERAAK